MASRAGAGAGAGVFRVSRGAMTEERYRRGWLREDGLGIAGGIADEGIAEERSLRIDT